MATKKKHPTKTAFKDEGITVYNTPGSNFTNETTVNVHPDDEEDAVELLEGLGYTIDEAETHKDTIEDEEFVRIIANGSMGIVEGPDW